jgi:hypothetical protein
MKCGCGQPAIGAACVPGVAYTAAWCRECLEATASGNPPEWARKIQEASAASG